MYGGVNKVVDPRSCKLDQAEIWLLPAPSVGRFGVGDGMAIPAANFATCLVPETKAAAVVQHCAVNERAGTIPWPVANEYGRRVLLCRVPAVGHVTVPRDDAAGVGED